MKSLDSNQKFVDSLTEWKPQTPLEKKLVLGIIHRKNHKDVQFKDNFGISNATLSFE